MKAGARRRGAVKPRPVRSAAVFGAFLLVSFSAALGGVFFRPGDWYGTLAKPAWTPPGWLFGPVWTVLYASMAAAAWLVWRRRGLADRAMAFWLLQLGLNAAWSWLFFGLHRPDLALVDILALAAAVAVTAGLFLRASAPAGWLMVPYFLWVAFAAALNTAIWRLNR